MKLKYDSTHKRHKAQHKFNGDNDDPLPFIMRLVILNSIRNIQRRDVARLKLR